MKLINIGNKIKSQDVTGYIDLRDILEQLGEKGLKSIWSISSVDCYGEGAEKLCKLSDYGKKISGEELYSLANDIYQTVEGCFEAFGSNGKKWLLIRAVDGSEFDIETDDFRILELLRHTFIVITELDI
jgi:hypothetical protein